MSNPRRQRLKAAETEIKKKAKPSGWIIPTQTTTFADPDKWSNIDADVTRLERRTWTSLTVLGFWISDAMNAQGLIDKVPLMLNGAIEAELHVPFPVAARSSFGFYLARFAIMVRLITALFWHAIQTDTGSTALTQCIQAIWPGYLDILNHIPASIGITSQEMVSHFLFWSIQFPILLTPPHKLKWSFWFKSIIVIVVSIATVITMTTKAGGTGEIWNQEYSVHGSERSWLIFSSMMAVTSGWATMAVNVPDFTRYLKKPQGVYWLGLFLPLTKLVLGIFGIICTSSAKVAYGEYIWDPLSLAAQWHGPAGRCGAFFVGFAWYINIRRGVVLVTITAGWVMVPWKIVYSAEPLLNFMTGLSIFLCPIAAILSTDYWLVKSRHIDVPSLYRRHARYRYDHGYNWRAAIALLVSVVPNTPGLAKAVNSDISISVGIAHVYDMNYLYGFSSAALVYWLLSYFLPASETLIPATIHEDLTVMDIVEYQNDVSGSEKKAPIAETTLS